MDKEITIEILRLFLQFGMSVRGQMNSHSHRGYPC